MGKEKEFGTWARVDGSEVGAGCMGVGGTEISLSSLGLGMQQQVIFFRVLPTEWQTRRSFPKMLRLLLLFLPMIIAINCVRKKIEDWTTLNNFTHIMYS